MNVQDDESDSESLWNYDNVGSMEAYLRKKSIALGLLVFALFSSNTSQLRNILHSEPSKYFFFVATGLTVNVILQYIVFITIIFKSRFDMNSLQEYAESFRINRRITIGIIIMTINNFLISALTILSSF